MTKVNPNSARRGTNLPHLKSFNESVVLDAIRRVPQGVSRVELTALTGLSAQTITNICRRLLDSGTILDSGKVVASDSTTVGKRRTLLTINPRAYAAIGVHLDPAVVTVSLVGVTGEVISSTQTKMHDVTIPDQVLINISKSIKELVDTSNVLATSILGIGVAVPGPIDFVSGSVISPPQLRGWGEVNIRDRLAELTGFQVFIDKDVTAAAIAEKWTGSRASRAESENFIFYYMGTGSGIGLVSNDVVIRGAYGNAGELGGLSVACTTQELLDEARERGVDLGPDALSPADAERLLAQLSELARNGNESAQAAIEHWALIVARSAAAAATLLDSAKIVFGGPIWLHLEGFFLPIVKELVKASPYVEKTRETLVETSHLGNEVGTIGAASLVFDSALSVQPQSLVIDI